MSNRFWLLGFLGLISVALLVACGSKYNSSSNGLVLVGSQGSNVIQTFSFNLNSGHSASISNPSGTSDVPFSIALDPAGQYAYVVLGHSAIGAFKVDSGGKLSSVGSSVMDPNPVSLAMDSAGKFLFVAEGTSGLVNVYAIGSGGALSAVKGTYNFASGLGFQTPNIVAVAPTPTVLPAIGINGTQNSVCSVPGNTAPTSEYLYAVDSNNYVVWEFSVDTSTGALGNPSNTTAVPSFTTDAVPAGVAVDPCDRFVYVSGSLHNKISEYTICTTVNANAGCPYGNGALVEVSGSPLSASGSANGLGAIVADPLGNNIYVLGTLSNTVSGFKITPITGALTPLNPATVNTGSQPKSITIRADDNWMFVSNYGSATVSQYSITPATGALSAESPLQTDNYPWGVAVK